MRYRYDEPFLTDRKNRLSKVLEVAAELRASMPAKAEVRPCKWCGDSTIYPDQLCSTFCREDYYNENSYELYEDERHPETTHAGEDGERDFDSDEEE